MREEGGERGAWLRAWWWQTHRCLGQTQNAPVFNVQTILQYTKKNKGNKTHMDGNKLATNIQYVVIPENRCLCRC